MAVLSFPVIATDLIVPVLVGLDAYTLKQRVQAGLPLRPPIQARALVDTGTDVSCVSASTLQALAIAPAITTHTHTAVGQVPAVLVEISLSIIGLNLAPNPMLAIPDLLAMSLPHPVPGFDVLIGMDVLQCQFHIDGPARQFSFTF